MKLHSFSDYLNEKLTGTQKAQKRLDKAMSKTDKFGKKARASEVEIDLRKDQLKYEREKEKVKREIESATDNTSKGMAKDKLKKLKEDWKETKKKAINQIKILRKG